MSAAREGYFLVIVHPSVLTRPEAAFKELAGNMIRSERPFCCVCHERCPHAQHAQHALSNAHAGLNHAASNRVVLQNLKLVAAVEQMASKKGVTPGQLAMAWLLAKSPDVIPIPGTKRIAALEENVGAAAVDLSAEEVAELEAAVPFGGVAGDRYAHMEHLTYKANM
jgi:hypothetical protein